MILKSAEVNIMCVDRKLAMKLYSIKMKSKLALIRDLICAGSELVHNMLAVLVLRPKQHPRSSVYVVWCGGGGASIEAEIKSTRRGNIVFPPCALGVHAPPFLSPLLRSDGDFVVFVWINFYLFSISHFSEGWRCPRNEFDSQNYGLR